jgi:competence protein ComEA
VRDRVVGLWHRVRAGEEPVAFGAVVVLVAVGAGLMWFWAGARSGGVPAAAAAPRSHSEDGPPSSVSRDLDVTATTANALAVHVAGAVARPGLYRLPNGSRVADAIGLAGGKVPGADLDRVNLAARLVDGQQILVTRRGDPVPGGSPTGSGGEGPAAGSAGLTPAEPIDLNGADIAALDGLPGIGPATARAIIDERTRRGGFRSTRDLLRVPGIGQGRFARLKDLVRV